MSIVKEVELSNNGKLPVTVKMLELRFDDFEKYKPANEVAKRHKYQWYLLDFQIVPTRYELQYIGGGDPGIRRFLINSDTHFDKAILEFDEMKGEVAIKTDLEVIKYRVVAKE